MSHKFHVVDDATVVLREKGVFRQVAVYRLGERLFGEYRKGQFVSLLGGDGTSAPAVSWQELDIEPAARLKDGRMVVG